MGNKRSTKPKLHLVFDETKRREFLTGFRKRKLQRKKHAKDEFEKALKEERKRIKAESKEEYKKLVASNRDIPELENLLAEEYEDDEATVKIISLSTNDIARQNNWIGENRPKYSSDHEDEEEEEEEEEEPDKVEIPGMELTQKPVKKEPIKKEKFDSEANLKKKLKKIATKRVQKSKVFQMKNKLERQKQKKKSSQQRRFKEKQENKHKGRKKRS